ncbi:LysR substrate-binding domain-containing protein [Burkholderia stagnalis]|nr:LysR substrate-binding domain-containing protein [Burkholderia stagnalis]
MQPAYVAALSVVDQQPVGLSSRSGNGGARAPVRRTMKPARFRPIGTGNPEHDSQYVIGKQKWRGTRMDLQALKIFKAVADEGGIARAATVLNCVQSNVSTRLRQLEAQLGIALFYRVNGRLVITNEGSQLLGYAERILQLADEARSIVKGGGEPAGKLRIGATEATAAARLPRMLAGFHQRYPKVDMSIETGSIEQITRAVIGHRLDVALVPAPVVSDELADEAAFDEELLLITAHSHPAVTSASDLRDCSFLAFRSDGSHRARFERWLEGEGLKPRIVLEFGALEVIIACVGAGMGVSLMPRSLIERRDLTNVIKCHAMLPDVARNQVRFVWRKDIAQHSARDAFIRNLKGHELRAS